MNYLELKKQIENLTPEQQLQPVFVFSGDEEAGKPLTGIEVTQEDEWFDHGDSIGNEAQLREEYGERWEDEAPEFTKVPAGTPFMTTAY